MCFILYTPYEPYLRAIRALKRKYPKIRSCLIVTDCVPGREDLPQYMTPRAKRSGNRAVKLAKSIDGFALLTKHLANALEIGDKPFVITECICNERQILCQTNEISHNVCLYTGSISVDFNICELADAFALMDNAELWICGRGSGQAYIEEMAQKHDNIKYLGFLKQEELQEYRDKCDFLINPRKPTGTYTKYSFPSKTAEYMMSGKPVIMYKLEGVPDEYDPYLNYLQGNDPEEIKRELEAIFSADYQTMTEKALKARAFMTSEKSSIRQAEKIISLFQR